MPSKENSSFLSRHWWQGVAGIAALIALAIAILQFTTAAPGRSDGPSPTPVASGISGNCNAQGSGNTVNCLQTYPSRIGNAELSGFLSNIFLFDGSPSDLPTPPSFGKSEANWHCPAWETWLTHSPEVYTVDPSALLSTVSGEGEQVAFIDYKVQLVDRKPLKSESKITYLQCNYGGGGDVGYIAEWNTLQMKATLHDVRTDDGSAAPMPPASLNLNGPQHESVLLNITSQSKYLYSGIMVATVVINGERQDLAIGSPENPLRWVGGKDAWPDSSTPMWDWDPVHRSWVKNSAPFSGN